MRRLVPFMKMLPARNLRLLPDDNNVYLWNSQPENFNLPVGHNVDPQLLSEIPINLPLRLFSFEKDNGMKLSAPLENTEIDNIPSVGDLAGKRSVVQIFFARSSRFKNSSRRCSIHPIF